MRKLFLSSVLALLVFTACEKVKDQADDIETTQEAAQVYSEDFTTANSLVNLVMDFVDNDPNLQQKKGGFSIMPPNALVHWYDSLFTDGSGVFCIIDFGQLDTLTKNISDIGLMAGDGTIYNGKLGCLITKPMDQPGAEAYIFGLETDLYSSVFRIKAKAAEEMLIRGGVFLGPERISAQNSIFNKLPEELRPKNLVYGIALIRRETTNNLYFRGLYVKQLLHNKSVWYSIGAVSYEYLIKQTAGFDTKANLSDDVFESSGYSKSRFSGEVESETYNAAKYSYNVEIQTPLVIKDKSCSRIPVQGVMTFEAAKKAEIDYGNGDCDTKAKITIGKISKEVSF